MRATEEARNVLIETILDVYIEGKFDAMIIKEDERKKKKWMYNWEEREEIKGDGSR